MPTTQPLDDDELGDIFEGRLRPIAAFAQGAAEGESAKSSPAQPDAAKTTSQAPATATSSTPKPTAAASAPSEQRAGAQPSSAGGFNGNLRINNLRAPRISINQSAPSARETAPVAKTTQTTAPDEPHATPFTPEALVRVWHDFVDTHQAEHLLINAMRVAVPRPATDNTFTISHSPVHIGYIRENLDRITSYVRTRLDNDTIEFVLNEVSEDSPEVWNERELLQHIVEKDPEVGAFINRLNLKLL